MGEIRQLTLAAFYNKKDFKNDLWGKIERGQDKLKGILNDNYQPYAINQIHGTILGLEAAKLDSSVIGKNFLEIQKKTVEVDLLSILNSVNTSSLLPFEIRIGGFLPEDYSFTSRSLSPYHRSFSIQRNVLVTMGWPSLNGANIPNLNSIRRRISSFGGLHKYHTSPDSYDNDFYFVLGNLLEPLEEERSKYISKLMRKELGEWGDTRITLRKEDLGIVAYKDTNLREDPRYYSIESAIQCVDELRNIYPKYEDVAKNPGWLGVKN